MLSFIKFFIFLTHVLTLCYALPPGTGKFSNSRSPPRHLSLPERLTYHVDSRNGHEAKASSMWRSKKSKNAHLEEASFHDKKVQEIGNKLHANPEPLTPEQQAKADARHEKIRNELRLARAHVVL